MNSQNLIWARNTAAHRWYGFGRYYAMFPPSFASEAIKGLTNPGDMVIDPFCGRGNGPFTAVSLGRPSLGIDINPIAWLFTSVKLNPEKDVRRVLERLNQIAQMCRSQDRRGYSQFERMAWSPDVRAILRVARRELDWRNSITDRTLMAFIALHMQDKLGAGLSNSLWPTIACSPQYAVKWWGGNGFTRAPKVDPVALLSEKIQRRYQYGPPVGADGNALLADARRALRKMEKASGKLLITSPPYSGITDYWNDHWIRLWLLGYSMRKNWKRSAKYENRAAYRRLIQGVFREAKQHLDESATILVRSDLRRRTAEVCLESLRSVWPNHNLLIRASEAQYDGVSAHHGRGGSKAKEIDILVSSGESVSWGFNHGFRLSNVSADPLVQ